MAVDRLCVVSPTRCRRARRPSFVRVPRRDSQYSTVETVGRVEFVHHVERDRASPAARCSNARTWSPIADSVPASIDVPSGAATGLRHRASKAQNLSDSASRRHGRRALRGMRPAPRFVGPSKRQEWPADGPAAVGRPAARVRPAIEHQRLEARTARLVGASRRGNAAPDRKSSLTVVAEQDRVPGANDTGLSTTRPRADYRDQGRQPRVSHHPGVARAQYQPCGEGQESRQAVATSSTLASRGDRRRGSLRSVGGLGARPQPPG